MPPHPLGALAPLAAYAQFIPVRLVTRPDGKVDKWPIDYRTGNVTVKGSGGAHDPAVWLTYEAAALCAEGFAYATGQRYGVGFVLTDDDPFVCVDIDSCGQPDGTWSPLALELCAALPGSVVEVSQSGSGLHIWCRSTTSIEHGKKNVALGLECYSSLRFILLGSGATGTMAEDCPGIRDVAAKFFPLQQTSGIEVPDDGPCAEWSGPADDNDLIEIAKRSHSAASVFGDGVTFTQLWEADADALGRRWPGNGRAYDASSADMALAQRLAFFTGRDAGRIDRLMRRSGLMREKYDRPDYLPRTIATACGRQQDVYSAGKRAEQPPAPAAQDAVSVAPVAQLSTLSFAAAANGYIDAKIETVVDALRSAESGVRIGFDAFLERIMIAGPDGKWRVFEDADYVRLRADFGRRGFKAISPEIMRSAVLLTAVEHRFDSAIEFANGLKWDGICRIDTALPTYYGTEDTPYTRAVGAYLFTAMAARALMPGAQVDMVPVFVGMQGKGKTSAVRALCPDIRFFSEINLKKIDDDNMSRKVRGKLVGEIAELRGLSGRDQESVKAWLTRREEQWVPKYFEFEMSYGRRLVLVGTTNETEFLDDPTGERRWLPVMTGDVDVEALQRDCEQLWAEGVHRFKVSGVA
ncbi:MAG: hypothetical protein K2Q07_06330, partial [Burkholderiaceae bacterium]|nr:hypothetical protein [Burkholderiaceae bacterium]